MIYYFLFYLFGVAIGCLIGRSFLPMTGGEIEVDENPDIVSWKMIIKEDPKELEKHKKLIFTIRKVNNLSDSTEKEVSYGEE